MKIKQILYSLIILIVYSGMPGILIAGTSGKIAGKVTHTETGEPLAGANVIIRGLGMGAATNIDGDYFILNVPPGVYEVETTMIGFTRLIQTEVRVRIDQTTRLEFSLQSVVIGGEEVTIIAEKPLVNKNLTASRQAMGADEFANGFVTNVEEAIGTMQGVNVNGGIRGGFGLEVAYKLDGLSIRDGASGTNYSGINTSSIQELEVLTGGYNAEHGQAHGAIINIITKTARDRMHGAVQYNTRPPGIYHWGNYMYGDDIYENRVIAQTPEYWAEYNIPDWMVLGTSDTLVQLMEHYSDSTLNRPGSEVFKDYNQRWSRELQATFYGPIGKKLNFMVTGRYLKDAPNFPQQFEYNPEWHGEIKLNYDLASQTRLGFKVFGGGQNNSGPSKTLFSSSEDMRSIIQSWSTVYPAHITGAYDEHKYYPWFSNHFIGTSLPEYVRVVGGQLKLSHNFDPSKVLEVSLSNFRYTREGSRRNGGPPEDYGYWAQSLNPDLIDSLVGIVPIPQGYGQKAKGTTYNNPGFGLFNDEYSDNTNSSIDMDFLWQVNQVHQLKTGLYGSYQYVNRYIRHGATSGEIRVSDIIPNTYHPYEGAFYLQDRIETEGMILNLGIRVDMYNANRWVGADPFDPLLMDEDTKGNIGQSIISIGDVLTRKGVTDGDNFEALKADGSLVRTKSQFAISPRIGISHPITETTVLHFMYGHFNQRPTWNKLAAYPSIHTGRVPYSSFPRLVYLPQAEPFEDSNGNGAWDDGEVYEDTNEDGEYNPDFFNSGDYHGIVYDESWSMYAGNPALTFEKTIQYEIGFDQAIGDNLRLDVTLYYRDAKNLTASGFTANTFNEFGFDYEPTVHMHPDVSAPTTYMSKTKSGGFEMWMNNVHQDVRGLEFTVDAQISRFASLRIDYDQSYNKTGRYGPNALFREIPGGALFDSTVTKAVGQQDTYNGGNNFNLHQDGNQNQFWHPNNTVKVMGNISLPEEFGPKIAGIHPLSGWTAVFQTNWAQGRQYTWYSPSDTTTGFRPPNNRRWEDKWNTNATLNKEFAFAGGQRVVFSMKIFNLFNNKWLNLPAPGTDRDRYHEPLDPESFTDLNGNGTWERGEVYEDANADGRYSIGGKLPTVLVGYGEYQEEVENVWRWYEFSQLPREVLFEIMYTF